MTCLNEAPPTNADESTFRRVDKEKCILYVPYGTAAFYQNHVAFRDFKYVVETDVAGISEKTITDKSQVISETYTDLLGRPVKAVGQGLVVKTIRYANGSKRVKIVRTGRR